MNIRPTDISVNSNQNTLASFNNGDLKNVIKGEFSEAIRELVEAIHVDKS